APYVLAPAGWDKRVLTLLQQCGWHPRGSPRSVLDRRPEKVKDSLRAFQLSDDAAVALEELLGSEVWDDSLPEMDHIRQKAAFQELCPQSQQVVKLILEGTLTWRPYFQLHEYLVSEDRCDRPESKRGDSLHLGIRWLTSQQQEQQDQQKQQQQEQREEEEEEQQQQKEEEQQQEQQTGLPVAARQSSTGSATTFTFIELFAGIGGFRLGCEAVGGSCVFASEIHPWARQIYELNFGNEKTLAKTLDIRKVRVEDVPQHDILTAGFPCQPFSAGGGTSDLRPQGFRDPRGQIFWQVIRLLQAHEQQPEMQPKAVVLENVPGLIKNDISREVPTDDEETMNSRCGLPVVLGALSECGYSVSWKVYDSQHFVPQMRERVFIVGIRNDLVNADEDSPSAFRWPELSSEATKPQLRDILHGSFDSLEDSALRPYRLTSEQWELVAKQPYFQKRPDHRLPPLDGVSNTIRSSYRSGFRLFSQFVPVPDSEASSTGGETETPELAPLSLSPYRFFTPRECARLQGFPEWFRFTGDGQ
ncbi:unnamed protein product, partial [Polarella glacialis]